MWKILVAYIEDTLLRILPSLLEHSRLQLAPIYTFCTCKVVARATKHRVQSLVFPLVHFFPNKRDTGMRLSLFVLNIELFPSILTSLPSITVHFPQ